MMADRNPQIKQEMVGGTVFTNLVPNAHQVPNNNVMVPGGMTVSLMPVGQQQSVQQIQHHPQQSMQTQPQTQTFPQQQFIQMYQLAPQQCQQSSNMQQLVVAQIPNIVGGVGMPTMILTGNPNGMLTSGGNMINGGGGNIIIATANGQTTSLGELVQTISVPNVVFTTGNQDPNQAQLFTQQTVVDGSVNQSLAPGDGMNKNGTILHSKTIPPSRTPADFPCNICNRSYKYRHGLTQHIQQTHMGKKPFPCKECNKAFTRRYQLERHIRLHNGTHDTYTCNECGEVFYMRESFLLHIRSRHGVTDDAGLALSASSAVVSDQPVPILPSSANEYHCDICGATLDTRNMLVKHRRTEHAGHPMLSRPLKIARRRRMQPNIGEDGVPLDRANGGRFQCFTCGKRFLNGYGLKRHERTHTGERPHDCDICGLSFMERSHMKQHRMTHTGETPYHCHICQRGFSRKFSHQRHLRWHREGTVTKSALNQYTQQQQQQRPPGSFNTDELMADLLNSVVSESLALTMQQQQQDQQAQDESNTSILLSLDGGENSPPITEPPIKLENTIMGFDCCSSTDLMNPFSTSFTMQLNDLNSPLPPVHHHSLTDGVSPNPSGSTLPEEARVDGVISQLSTDSLLDKSQPITNISSVTSST